MANIRRTRSIVPTVAEGAALAGLLVVVCVATAFWAMWTMLGAAFDSDWLQVALMLILWLAAMGPTYLLSLFRPPGG